MLTEAGYRFEVVTPSEDAEPDTIEGISPAALVVELACRKAADVAPRVLAGNADALLLAADTVAECDGEKLGKPKDVDHARQMLTKMSGRRHRVLTAICLAADSGEGVELHAELVTTYLQMAPLTSGWITPYLESGGWRGKAGAFGYQDGLQFVSIVQGSESNVVGLPMERLTELLAQRRCFPGAAEQP